MDYESEGIRHVTIQKKEDNQLDNTKLEKRDLLDGDTDQVNFDSLLKAVIDISDRLHDHENKFKQHDTEQKICDDGKDKHSNNQRSSKKHVNRPRTAVLKYRRHDSSSSDSDFGNDSSTFSSNMSIDSSASRSRSARPPSSSNTSVTDGHSPNKLSMSFSNNKVRDIDIENQRLLREILKKKSTTPPKKKSSGPIRVPPAAAINRTKKQRDIERENLRLLSRLQAVKPTTTLRREKLLHDHMKSERCVDRLSKSNRRRPASAPVSRPRSLHTYSREENFDNESFANSSISSVSMRSGSTRASSARVRAPRKVRVEEAWEPGW